MREPAGGSAAAGVRGVAPLSDGKSQFRGGTRGPYSQAWGWRMWYLGEVVCPVMAGAGQRNVMDGKEGNPRMSIRKKKKVCCKRHGFTKRHK